MVKASMLIAWCKQHLGDGYVYGAVGEICTSQVLQRCQTMYGKKMGADYYVTRCKRWIGKWVCDCSGLLKAGRKSLEGVWKDLSAEGTYQSCSTKGRIAGVDLVPGAFVFMMSGGRMVHVGMYIGDGQVIEARGVDYGIVITQLAKRPWSHWGWAPWLTPDVVEDQEGDMGDASNPKPDDPYDITIDYATKLGVIQSPDYWIRVLKGDIPADPIYLRTMMDRYHALIKKP